jgi:protocatechuate 3,4-dioxygenase beta subunit
VVLSGQPTNTGGDPASETAENSIDTETATPPQQAGNGAEQDPVDLSRTDFEATTLPGETTLLGAAPGTIASFSGRVVDEKGSPVEGVTIFANAQVDWASSWDASRNVLPKDWGGTTDTNGNFKLPEAPRERLRFLLEFRHPDFATFELFNQPAHPGRTRELGSLTMTVGFTLSGTVITPEGQPVANAEVVPYRGDGPRGFDPREVGKRPLLDPVFTDEQGRFTLDTLPTRPVRLKARADFYFEAWSQTANGESGEELDGMEIRLAEATNAFGIVLDSARKPIAGARVELRDNRWEDGAEEAPFLAAVESDEAGKFQLMLPDGTLRTNITVGAEGFYVELKRLSEADLNAPLEIVMTPMDPVTGVVVDESGSAVAGATVALLQSRGNMPDPRTTPANVSVTADADGVFTLLPNLKTAWGARFHVYAWDENHAVGQSILLRIRESENGKAPELRIVLKQGFEASGRVLQPDGSLMAKARVHLRKLRKPRRNRLPNVNESQRGGDIVQRTTSAADGTYSFTNLPAGDYRLEAYYTGYSPVESDDFGLVDVDYQTDLRLIQSCGIAGEVVGDIGAFRQLRVTANSPGLDRLEVFVDGRGRFEFLEMMPASWNLTLTDASDVAGNPSFTFGNPNPLSIANGIEVREGVMTPLQMELDVSGLGRVTGVVRINGEPRPNYAVFVVPQMSPGSNQGGVGRRAIMRQMRSVATDYQGRFTLAGLQPNEYWILVEPPNGWPDLKFVEGNSAPEALQRGIVSVRDSAVTEFAFDIYLGNLQIDVLNPKGTNNTPARLVPSPQDGRRARSTRLSRSGHTFTDIPTGTYVLMVHMGNEWQNYPVSVPSLATSAVGVMLPEKGKTSSSKKKNKKKK